MLYHKYQKCHEDRRLLSREHLRKIASLGREWLNAEPFWSRQVFLTLLWGRMLQGKDLLHRDHLPLENVLENFGRLLKKIPNPARNEEWDFFTNTLWDLKSAENFWQALGCVDFDSVWARSEAAGWIYQYFLEPDLQIFRSPGAPKINTNQLAMRTQQFTPKWIADFLAQNTLGRLWIQMHPDSRLSRALPYLVPENTPRPAVLLKRASEIKILDPACGTMHLGLSAIKVLEAIYKEERENAGKPGWPAETSVRNDDEIPESIIRNNLFGIDIDPPAIELAALTLYHAMNGKFTHPPNLLCTDSLKNTFIAKLKKNGFPDQFDVVLLNPPYLDRRDYNPQLKDFMVRYYKKSGRNLYTAFLEKSLELLNPSGRLGAVTPQTFMFIRSFADLRKTILEKTAIETLVHTGLNTFEDAVVDCAFYVLRREANPEIIWQSTGKFFQLTAVNNPEKKKTRLIHILSAMRDSTKDTISHLHLYRQADFSALPDSPWVYWIGPRMRQLFSELPALGTIAELRQGLATTDNDRFLRYWWEIPHQEVDWGCCDLSQAISSSKKWFPYMKGGEYLRWYGNREFLVNWGQDGKEIKEEITRRYPYLKGNWKWVAKNTEFYFREGITYSYLTSGTFSARYSPPGSIFDVAGSSIFCDDPDLVLGILNSRWCRFALGLINPTVNFQVGDLKRLPVPAKPRASELKKRVRQAIEIARSLETFEETSPDFITPPPWPDGDRIIARKNHRLAEIQQCVDREIYQLYGLGRTEQKLIEQQTSPDEISTTITPEQLAQRWISYAVGICLGRFKLKDFKPTEIIYPVSSENDRGLAGEVRRVLEMLLDRKKSQTVIELACPSGNLAQYLLGLFFELHFQQYRRRPIYWLMKFKENLIALYYQNLNDEKIGDFPFLNSGSGKINFDHGILANMRPFKKHFAIPFWQR
ncbi:MAG: N-6 DNA methylase [Phycisphaerae bacterium]